MRAASRYRGWLVALALTTATAASCATVSTQQAADPQQEATRVVAAGLRASAAEADQAESVATHARLNPAACDAPEWEILWRGVWVRVSLRPGRDTTDDGRLLLDGENVGQGAIVPVRISITGRSDPRPAGLRYRIVELIELLPERDR